MISLRLLPATRRACLLAAYFFLVLLSPVASGFELPPVREGSNIDDCAAKLDTQGGGWCEITQGGQTRSISAVWPKNLDRRTHMIVGPASVLLTWNGAAFDEENLLLYFTGGGHADYGGNEVYEFDLKTGKWSRLTDPSPLDFLSLRRPATASAPARYCWVPDMRSVPASTHTYDGIQFNSKTQTIFLINMGAANGSCFDDPEGKFLDDPRLLSTPGFGAGVYEFNPSRDEVRHNLAPLTWQRIADPDGTRLSYPRTTELPDGEMLIGSSLTLNNFDPLGGRIGKKLWQTADFGDGNAIYHPSNVIFSLHGPYLVVSPLGNGVTQRVNVPRFHGRALAVADNGHIVTWDGYHRVMTLDPSALNSGWKLYDWSDAGPPTGNWRVYSKWQYVPDYKMFVGISTHATGVWIYKHPADMPAIQVATVDPQSLIDRALPGATVTIPPGIYGQGLFIQKSLTVKLKNVRLWGVAQRKGIINVNCDNCKVVIEDFHGEGRNANCIGSNCAGIKAEGIDFDLTVRRADIENTVMGILTDNRGGRLVVENSTVEHTGLNDNSTTLGHGIYAGKIDQLVIRSTTVRNVNSDGHMLKSRAQSTIIESAKLLGENGFHSRSIDIPCGGKLEVKDSLIQHGHNTDNSDVIAIGTEPRGVCNGLRSSDVSIRNSVIIIDRDHSTDERARSHGPNYLFQWRAPLAAVEVKDNQIVNLERWSTTATQKGDVLIPDFSSQNQMCKDSKSCGL